MKFEASNRKFKEFLVVSGGVSILFRHVIFVSVKMGWLSFQGKSQRYFLTKTEKDVDYSAL